MLFIVFGGEYEVGYRIRHTLNKLGFTTITKYNYVKPGGPVSLIQYEPPYEEYNRWFEDKRIVEKERILQCDYRYELHDLISGFDQSDIMDAIHGINNAVLTVGSASMEFVRQLKIAFGGYVTLIFSYIDDITFDILIRQHPDITDDEIEHRKKTISEFNAIYMTENQLFDEIVLYTGENSSFHFGSFEDQLSNIIKRRKKIEKTLNSQKIVELPYKGNEPYIFISYCHDDKDLVYPILALMQRNGFRIWYDEGIEGGETWRKILREKIEKSSMFLLFVSRNSAKSFNVTKEITVAQVFSIPYFSVELEEAHFDPTDEAWIDQKQKVKFLSDDFEKKLIEGLPKKTSTG